MATLTASRKKNEQERIFLAALQGVDLEAESKKPDDVLSLNKPYTAQKEGFGAGEGLGFMQLGE